MNQNLEKRNREILKLHYNGAMHQEIAKTVGLDRTTVTKILLKLAAPEGYCRNCGKKLQGQNKHNKELYCSRHCRYEWTKNNSDLIVSKSAYVKTCAYCGKTFIAYGCLSRKYCSHHCYINDRFGEVS